MWIVAFLLNCTTTVPTPFPTPFAHCQEKAPEKQTASQAPLRDLNSYFPFSPPKSLPGWNSRKSDLKKHLQVSLGLWPEPKRTKLNQTIHGLIDKGEYTIEKVYFESVPGLFVTGNLYKPKKRDGKVPGVLCPYGHFSNGRFISKNDKEIDAEIASGAETFRSNAKSILQSQCANLARMGCVVFQYDMIGYADSQQISYDVAHRFAKQRPNLNGSGGWGLFSPLAESRLQTVMGLQTWNSIRSLDFLESLPEVDPKRIGVTGASGGGTQTFILCALDDRPAAAFPCVMVSTAMQGGCTCENCSYLRVGTGNVEIAAMFAPKPMGLTAANDWTKEMKTKGFPELQALYELFGAKQNIELTSRTEFGHNMNQVSREAMYRWFKTHLKFTGNPVEKEIKFVDPKLLSVYDDQHPRPRGGETLESDLLNGIAKSSDKQLLEMDQRDARMHIQTFIDVVKSPLKDNANFQGVPPTTLNRWKDPKSSNIAMMTVGGDHTDSDFRSIMDQFVNAGLMPLVIQHQFPSEQWKQTRRVSNTREAAAYTLGYNVPLVVRRAVSWSEKVTAMDGDQFFYATGHGVPEAALNASLLRDQKRVRGIIINTAGFRFAKITDIRDPDFLPGATKYLDLPGLLSLAAPKPILLIGEDIRSAKFIVKAYAHLVKPNNLTVIKQIPDGVNEGEFIRKWIGSTLH